MAGDKEPAYVGIDVGTGSARAAIFDARGTRLGMGTAPLAIFRPQEDYVEQSSEDIWRACGHALRLAMTEAAFTDNDAARIAGVGFDATCSLVVLGASDEPVTVSPTGRDEQNVIVWMDHRATRQARVINEGRHDVLQYVGGAISPEMETPKLVWLKDELPASWQRARRFFDLPDFLSYRATGVDTRSLCTTVCKWTYLGHEPPAGKWDESFFRAVGLDDIADEGFAKIGRIVRPMGEKIGGLTATSAAELGLWPGTPVAVSIIDAHAGGLGLLGVPLDAAAPTEAMLEQRVALIGGTSSCHMAVSREAKFIHGIWGPYWSAMVPGMWLTEGGQSATGALIDHTIDTHARGAELRADAARQGTTVYALLNARLDELAARDHHAYVGELTRELHVLPDHHGNRSPRADPTLRGMVSGLKLTDSVDSLALLYLATVQSIALGTRHIVESMNAKGYDIRTIIACGGDTKNPLFVREHAEATGRRVVLAKEPEAVLLGAAMLGAVAAGHFPSLLAAMGAMNEAASIILPSGGEVERYYEGKYRVFLRMHGDQLAYRALMHT
ncbi:MAG TPA: FGGY-family carbohydrate kinase [Polyangiaceae bacterium]|nr:FGGY-family carbohydrate kinase [Polyangiaceae bacterium]